MPDLENLGGWRCRWGFHFQDLDRCCEHDDGVRVIMITMVIIFMTITKV